MSLAVDPLDRGRKALLESGHNPAPALLNHLLALFSDVCGHHVIDMLGRNLDLDPLNSITRDDSDSRSSGRSLLDLDLWRVLEADKPFDLRLDLRLLLVEDNTRNAQRAKRVAVRAISTVDALDFFESCVGLGLFRRHGLVVAKFHLGVRVVLRIGQLVSALHWVPEPDRLVKGSGHEQLAFWHVANINDARVVSDPFLVGSHIPRVVSREELNHVPLKVPDQNFAIHLG